MKPDTATGPFLSGAFREAFRHHPSGVAVITADPGDGPVAMTVSSLISVSMSPPTVAFSLSAGSSATAAIRRSASMVIHFIRKDNAALAQLAATSGADRFGPGVVWDRLPSGEPYYPEVSNWFVATPLHELSVPGATLIVAELMEGRVGGAEDTRPESSSIVYLNREWHGLRPLDREDPGKGA